jgi:transposase
MKGQLAIVRVARKLLRRIRAVLLSEKLYVRGVDGAVRADEIGAPDLPEPKGKGRACKTATLATADVQSSE